MTSSLANQNSRYVSGGISEVNDSGTKLEWWERTVFKIDDSDILFTVDKVAAGRLDNIAKAFLDDSKLWWVIAQYNAVLDPLNEIVEGRVLRIPTRDRVSLMLDGKTGGYPSQRVLSSSNVLPIV